jgi:3,4-dihydroxy 2-butanone 4-phosphate synthase/GTP cyclohydrolase II
MTDLIGAGPQTGGLPAIGKAMEAIAQAGRGVVILIRDPSPKSVSDWIGQRLRLGQTASADREARQIEIGIGSQILRDLEISEMVLLTTSTANTYVGLEAFGLRIVDTRLIE